MRFRSTHALSAIIVIVSVSRVFAQGDVPEADPFPRILLSLLQPGQAVIVRPDPLLAAEPAGGYHISLVNSPTPPTSEQDPPVISGRRALYQITKKGRDYVALRLGRDEVFIDFDAIRSIQRRVDMGPNDEPESDASTTKPSVSAADAAPAADRLGPVLRQRATAGDMVKAAALHSGKPLAIRGNRRDVDLLTGLLGGQSTGKTENDTSQIRIFSVEHPVDAGFSESLALIAGESNVRFAVDPVRQHIVATGDRAALDVIEALVRQLDRTAVGDRNAKSIQLRILWLMSGLESEGLETPGEMEGIVEQLAQQGLTDLRVAAQLSVGVEGRPGPFLVKGRALIEEPIDLDVSGQILAANEDRLSVQIELSTKQQIVADPRMGGRSRELCQISTVAGSPIGQAVVLGVAPHGSRQTAFVLQVLSR